MEQGCRAYTPVREAIGLYGTKSHENGSKECSRLTRSEFLDPAKSARWYMYNFQIARLLKFLEQRQITLADVPKLDNEVKQSLVRYLVVDKLLDSDALIVWMAKVTKFSATRARQYVDNPEKLKMDRYPDLDSSKVADNPPGSLAAELQGQQLDDEVEATTQTQPTAGAEEDKHNNDDDESDSMSPLRPRPRYRPVPTPTTQAFQTSVRRKYASRPTYADSDEGSAADDDDANVSRFRLRSRSRPTSTRVRRRDASPSTHADSDEESTDKGSDNVSRFRPRSRPRPTSTRVRRRDASPYTHADSNEESDEDVDLKELEERLSQAQQKATAKLTEMFLGIFGLQLHDDGKKEPLQYATQPASSARMQQPSDDSAAGPSLPRGKGSVRETVPKSKEKIISTPAPKSNEYMCGLARPSRPEQYHHGYAQPHTLPVQQVHKHKSYSSPVHGLQQVLHYEAPALVEQQTDLFPSGRAQYLQPGQPITLQQQERSPALRLTSLPASVVTCAAGAQGQQRQAFPLQLQPPVMHSMSPPPWHRRGEQSSRQIGGGGAGGSAAFAQGLQRQTPPLQSQQQPQVMQSMSPPPWQ